MGRRGESIFHRKDGRWEARYPAGKDAYGNTRYCSVYAKTYSEVKSKRTMAMKEPATPKSSILFSDVAVLWLSEKQGKIKEQTERKYRLCLDAHILPYFGKMRVSAITAEKVKDYLSSLYVSGRVDGNGGLSQNTVRELCVILQSVLNFAFFKKLGLTDQINVNKPKAEKASVIVLKKHEQQKLEAVLTGDPHGANLAILVALHTGMRIGEVCALRWNEIDLEERKIYVRATVIRDKNGKTTIGRTKSVSSSRIIPISERLSRLLQHEQACSNDVYVFTAPKKGGFMLPRTLQYHFRTVLMKLGLPLVKFHTLRHTFATRWIECGMDMKSLSEVLGHGNVQITLDIYVHSSDRLKREAIEKIERFSGQISGHTSAETVA